MIGKADGAQETRHIEMIGELLSTIQCSKSLAQTINRCFPKETLINWLHERITSLHGTRILAYLVDMSRLLRSVRLVLHLIR